ncbi:hypothetical protein DFJ73DRAFT_417873 [Zopfochytrium polystomum]|nr:hypothetical protein DFJ73DRAFT_417873 [Zopfochytrium polystomum]
MPNSRTIVEENRPPVSQVPAEHAVAYPHHHADSAREGSDSENQPALDSRGGRLQVGSDEWIQQRRRNHKEVERKRRETINNGINELYAVLPDGGDRNKGKVIQRAVAYIQELRKVASENLEKWTVEKLLLEQAIQNLGSTVDDLKAENEVLKDRIRQFEALVGDQSNPVTKRQRTDG